MSLPSSMDAIADVRELLGGHACGPATSDVEKANAQSRSNQFAGAEDVKLHAVEIVRNAAAPVYYEVALKNEKGSSITSTGALAVRSGAKTGRSPKDKRVVAEETSEANVWWGPVNIKMKETAFMVNRERAIDYLNTRDRLFVVDAYAGWDKAHRIAIRVVTSRAYHALFMRNMLVEPTAEEEANFVPDFTILNAGCFPANRYTEGMTSSCSVDIHFGRGEMVILGTQYAGEMKKGVLTLMMYKMPLAGQLPLHSSANEGPDGSLTLFFGLSGTGKTTLSADPRRSLIGDDEHVWTKTGVFNVEGGCYAKCAYLSAEKEPEIFGAVGFGAVVENVVTCDGFGVLPPVSKLTPEQVIYHFISGFTSKMAGTEEGVTKPVAAFSSCYGEPFLVWHPAKYATMLAEKLTEHSATAWLLNTGWLGGAGGQWCPLKYSRAIVDAIHSGDLAKASFVRDPVFRLNYPTSCPNVPAELLDPASSWADKEAFAKTSQELAALFHKNFAEKKYADAVEPAVVAAGPVGAHAYPIGKGE